MKKELENIINELSMEERNSLFEEAVNEESKRFIKIAILLGADVTINDNFAIIKMSEIGDAEIVKLLIKAGADPTANDNEAIIAAIAEGNTEVIKVFMEAGIKIDDEILSTVISEKDLEIMKLVLEKNGNK